LGTDIPARRAGGEALSRILRYNQLLDVRRMIGVGAFAYAAAHFTLYVVDQMFDWREIASEIVHRNRLTLGFVALARSQT
jgi:methionine sulfoxide reductase heme-binding subunit